MKVVNNFQKTYFGSNVFIKNAAKITNYEAGRLTRAKGYISPKATEITPIAHNGGWFVIDDQTLVGRLFKKILGENTVYSSGEPWEKALEDIIKAPDGDTIKISV